MAEREKIGELESFRMEISNILQSLKDEENIENADADITGVEIVGELDIEDMYHWQECKNLLLAIDKIDPQENKEKITQQLQGLEDRAKLVAVEVRSVLDRPNTKEKSSKSSFNYWLNNRNPLSYINAVLTADVSLEKIKQILHKKIDFYGKDGWKKTGSNKSE